MGNAQPQSVDGVPIRSVEEDAGLDSSATGGNVRITGLNVDVEQALKNAFEEGKKEGQANVKNLMEAVAADTYDNIHQQLAELQSKQTNQAKDLVSGAQSFFSSRFLPLRQRSSLPVPFHCKIFCSDLGALPVFRF